MTTEAAYGAAPLGIGASRELAEFIGGFRLKDVSEAAVHEARRSLLDAALANGQMGHVHDFDPVYMAGTRIFGCSPILGAAFALATTRTVPGEDLLCALVAGYEAGVRAGRAAPDHQDAGWHLTGTLGAIATAAAVARLLKFDAGATLHAIGIGATQAAGLQQNRGTPCKTFHAGKAAQAGLMAGLLAAEGFTCHPEPLEGQIGFASVYSRKTRIDALTTGLGRDWLIAGNGHKPYACGIVLHPALDVVAEARRRFGAAVLRTAEIDIAVHPDAIRLTGVEGPASGLMSKFSLRSAIALVVRNGAAGARHFEDGPVAGNAGDAIGRLAISSDAGLGRMVARGAVRSADGRTETIEVPHATGTREKPNERCATRREVPRERRGSAFTKSG